MPKKRPTKKPAKRRPAKSRNPQIPKSPKYPWIAADLRKLAVPIEQLKPDPENARTHDEANLRAIAASLKEFGQRKALVANRKTGLLEAGNGTLEAARRIGWSHLAVIWVEDDPETARGFSIADNRAGDLGDWDLELLLMQGKSIREADADLYDALLLADLTAADRGRSAEAAGGAIDLRSINPDRPPAMSWVLIGIPTVRFGEIAETVDGLAKIDGITLETTVNDGNRPKDRQRRP